MLDYPYMNNIFSYYVEIKSKIYLGNKYIELKLFRIGFCINLMIYQGPFQFEILREEATVSTALHFVF